MHDWLDGWLAQRMFGDGVDVGGVGTRQVF